MTDTYISIDREDGCVHIEAKFGEKYMSQYTLKGLISSIAEAISETYDHSSTTN